MKKIIITVSVNYSDYLKTMITNNIKYLTEDYIWVVVTTPDDIDTINLCETHSNYIKLLTTNVCYDNNKVFDKGSMINYVLNYYDHNFYNDSIIIQMESDILIDKYFIPELNLLVDGIGDDDLYTAKRIFISKPDDYIEHVSTIDDYTELHEKFNLGQLTGLGYLQIWKYNKNILYPSNTNASEIDIKFKNQFKNKVNMLSSVLHIGDTGVNWFGRKSQNWGVSS